MATHRLDKLMPLVLQGRSSAVQIQPEAGFGDAILQRSQHAIVAIELLLGSLTTQMKWPLGSHSARYVE